MHYLVFGTGAVGGLLGTRLALAGQRVTFLTRPKLARIVQDQGIKVTGDGPPGWLQTPTVITSYEQAFDPHPPDIILLTVKAYDCQEAADIIRETTEDPPPVVCFLNGIGNEAILASAFGAERVIPATSTTAVQMIEPGILSVERERGCGLASGHPLRPKLHSEMSVAGLNPHLYRDPERMKWSKLLTNIVTNASSAITGWLPAQILDHPQLFRVEIEALREAVRVMHCKGFSPQNLPKVPVGLLGRAISLPASLIQPILRRVVSTGRGDKLPSFNYDIARGRSEVGWLNGAVVDEGARVGVPTPANHTLTEVMLGLVEGRIDPDQYRNRPERLVRKAMEAGVPGLG
ncbi:MAG TPA: ketopantoate reductase family protein [Anaerolineae bacterium]|nr:ketopantoate reductase family protein [Anaerolineae bacterium]